MDTHHAANLSRGILCPHLLDASPSSLLYVRIQSTACEQKRWGQVALSLGPSALYFLAAGDDVVVHGLSERPRVTRALWQGVPWIRYALSKAWKLPLPQVVSRSGQDVSAYAEECWRSLPSTTRKELAYFRRFNPTRVGLYTCREAR